MLAQPGPLPGGRNMTFTGDTYACSICGDRLPREFVHRNRAGAYICHRCQAVQQHRGFLAVTWLRLRLWLHRASRVALYFAVGAVSLTVIVLVILILAE